MRIIASIQARMLSTRLPGKVLKNILGKPMLEHQIIRLKQSRLIDDVVVATTNNPADDEIVRFCENRDFSYYRGDEDDVLQRISDLISTYEADLHVECFGDSPLTDPRIVDEFIGYILKNFDDVDFVSNSIKTTYPPGSEVIVYKGQTLLDANKIVAKDDSLREHVSMHIYQRDDCFSVVNLEAPIYLSEPDIYMEVDTAEDFEVMTFIFENMKALGNQFFSIYDVITLLKQNPKIAKLNSNIDRRWKAYRND